MSVNESWELVGERLKKTLSNQEFSTWFEPVHMKFDQDAATLVVPNRFFSEWISERYMALLDEVVTEVVGRPLPINFKTDQGPQSTPSAVKPELWSAPKTPSTLSERYNFDSFVVGPCNELAHAASQAASNKPGKLYNPLFIFGGAGLGKTHLLNAAGNHILERWPGMNVYYTSLEGFTNELIQAVRYEGINRFQEKYRRIDCLLLDDIQFVAGRERTQVELFHTFNSLYESGKQIIVSGDKQPREIKGLEGRLRTRFEWGLLADMQPPDEETKVAILKEKAREKGFELPHQAAFFLAQQPESNIRVLEGYLTRIVAVSRFKNQEVTLELVQHVMGPLLGERQVSPEEVMRTVAANFGVKVSDLTGSRKTRDITLPRQVTMYLIRRLTRLSFPEIGRILGGKDHSTVVKGVKKLKSVLPEDLELSERVRVVERNLLDRDKILDI